MTTTPILLEFPKSGYREVQVDKEIFVSYLREFILGYVAKIDKYYRIGKMSGDIVFQGRTYGEIAKNAENTKFSHKVVKSVMDLNPELKLDGFSYGIWLSLDAFITEVYEDLIKDKIKEIHGAAVNNPKKLNTQTYQFNGQEVIFVMYDEAASGSEIYAVPVDVAIELNIEDYSGQQISRGEPFLEKIEKYSIKHMSCYNND